MKREPFIASRQGRWTALRRRIDRKRGVGVEPRSRGGDPEFPALYRGICHDLALAKKRHYGAELVERLNTLALRGREQLYGRRQRPLRVLSTFVFETFPRTVRAQGRTLLLAIAVFYGLGAFMFVCARTWPTLVEELVTPEQLAEMEEMYDGNSSTSHPRRLSTSIEAFGFYVQHNTSIGFRTFAGGLFFGVGAFLLLAYNGLAIGSILGHLSAVGLGGTLWPFVVTHGALELNAIVLSGVAGFRLGLGLLAPGRRSRGGMLRAIGPECSVLIGGAALMFIGAAFIEAFWSPAAIHPVIRIIVGALLWALVLFYFGFAGTASKRA